MDRTRERTKTLPGRLGGLLVLSAAAALIAACSAPAGATTAPTTAATTAPVTEPPMTAPASVAPTTAAAAITLAVATDADLGDFVTGEDGMSLYIFLPDAAAPGKSVCNDDCAANWPPLTVTAASDVAAGTGVTGTLGTVTRDDGTLQATLGGWPLHYFAADQAAGDVTGQGVGDVWYLAGPDGKGVGVPAGTDPEY